MQQNRIEYKRIEALGGTHVKSASFDERKIQVSPSCLPNLPVSVLIMCSMPFPTRPVPPVTRITFSYFNSPERRQRSIQGPRGSPSSFPRLLSEIQVLGEVLTVLAFLVGWSDIAVGSFFGEVKGSLVERRKEKEDLLKKEIFRD